jgi:hypothetical protein
VAARPHRQRFFGYKSGEHAAKVKTFEQAIPPILSRLLGDGFPGMSEAGMKSDVRFLVRVFRTKGGGFAWQARRIIAERLKRPLTDQESFEFARTVRGAAREIGIPAALRWNHSRGRKV